jgi:hypothetical protein
MIIDFSRDELILIFLTAFISFALVEAIKPFLRKCFDDQNKLAGFLRIFSMVIGAIIACSLAGKFSWTMIWAGAFLGGYNSAIVSFIETKYLK